MKQVTAVDERGRPWIVYEGDMAWEPCRQLQKLGVKEVVLPTDTFLYGRVPETASSVKLDGLTAEHLTTPALKEIVRRTIRLDDCVAYLRSLEAV